MDDRSIVALYLRRDETAIRQTAEKYGSRLRALAYGIVNDLQTAEECENDTYMEAWHTIPPHEPSDHFYAFLARITRHISLNRCRDRSRLKRSAFICELSAEMEQCIPAPDDSSCRMDDLAFRTPSMTFSANWMRKNGTYSSAATGFWTPWPTLPSAMAYPKARRKQRCSAAATGCGSI